MAKLAGMFMTFHIKTEISESRKGRQGIASFS